MFNELEQKILDAYRLGSDITYIVECFDISSKDLKSLLLRYKDSNRSGRTFTDEFKMMIAERDISGVARRRISVELEVNINTVKKSCEKFGQSLKDVATSENAYTRIEGSFDMSVCPSCHSRNVNEVDDKTTYCKSCGSECIHEEDYALSINWEYLE
jgi:transposase-like protein